MTDQELINLLAERVMGWHRSIEWVSIMTDPYQPVWRDKPVTSMDQPAIAPITWNPLENIADAWQVKEAMKAKLWYWTIADRGTFTEASAVYTYVEKDGETKQERAYDCGLSASRVICLAALKALGVEV